MYAYRVVPKQQSPSTDVLERALTSFRGELTVADAASKSGLPLRDAEEALRALAAEYSGHLAATSKGELVYSFPNGLEKPRDQRLIPRLGRAVAKFALGAVRLVVRAWVSVVLVGYAVVFLAILLALALRGGDDRDSSIGDGLSTVLRVVAEALFWTFHPFSPVYIGAEPRWMHAQARRNRLPFYERVNRFVFGPPQATLDPREQERNILAEIRRQKGRIAAPDVVRVTGLGRDEAERLLLRLVVDYHGDISVSDDGAILYSFSELRTTAATGRGGAGDRPVPQIWNLPVELRPLTGNSGGWNALFTFINGFNLVASGVVLANGLTLERLTDLIARMATRDPELAMLPLPPADGLPLVLGAIPFAFSLALFALPLVRVLRRPREVRRVQQENGWRGVLRQVLGATGTTAAGAARIEYTPEELSKAWAAAAGRSPSEAELRAAVQRLGGEVDLGADGKVVYKFDTAARELEALLRERARAADEEASPGEVVFSSADEGSEQAAASDDQSPPVRLLEEQRQPLEFIEKILAEQSNRRRK